VLAVLLTTMAALPALATARDRLRGAVAFGAGLLATGSGVGIGVPHVAKSGLVGLTVAGMLSLAAGFVLLGSGAVTLIASVRLRWRVPVTLALLVVVAVAVGTLGPAVAATNVPETELGTATPATLGLTYSDVEFETPDGVLLSGWYLPSRSRAALVLLHGAGSTRSSVLAHAEVLARHGYGVLLFDARGHGRSGGRAMDFGWYGDEDIAGALSYLQRRSDVDSDRLAAVGMSMGGEAAIGAAAGDERIKAVVAEGATNRVGGDTAWLSDEFGWRGTIQERLEWLRYGTTDLLTDARKPITLHDAVREASPRPVLLIAAGDVADEPKAARYIQSAAPDTVERWVVPDSGHTDGLATDPEAWEARVIHFLAAALELR
jgi:dienelactone hydrolase